MPAGCGPREEDKSTRGMFEGFRDDDEAVVAVAVELSDPEGSLNRCTATAWTVGTADPESEELRQCQSCETIRKPGVVWSGLGLSDALHRKGQSRRRGWEERGGGEGCVCTRRERGRGQSRTVPDSPLAVLIVAFRPVTRPWAGRL